MSEIILVDIGSTYTKVTAVDLDLVQIIAQANAPTTPQDVSVGLQNALARLDLPSEVVAHARKLACSSAAGGLRMVAIGLVEDLTAKAAKQAALGAGARVLKTYSFQLTEDDLQEIQEIQPDIILLAGGTDGGNRETILHNARALATLPEGMPIVIAGNRSVGPEVVKCFPERFSTYLAPNVMPQIGKLEVEPARGVIRKVFMEKIILAKGLNKAERLIEGIFMPTPAAVLQAGKLLSAGTALTKGWGDLLIVDVGGATTDVHSLGEGNPSQAGVVQRGLPEPFAKRTVEGDLGMRVSILPLVDAINKEVLARDLGWEAEKVEQLAQSFADNPELLPQNEAELDFDQALGYRAVHLGVGRHAGRLSEVYTPSGLIWMQDGKDLSTVDKIVGTGGVMVNSSNALRMLKGAEQQVDRPLELRPKKPSYFLDGKYILAPMGLLAEEYPEVALKILKKSLSEYELVRRD